MMELVRRSYSHQMCSSTHTATITLSFRDLNAPNEDVARRYIKVKKLKRPNWRNLRHEVSQLLSEF